MDIDKILNYCDIANNKNNINSDYIIIENKETDILVLIIPDSFERKLYIIFRGPSNPSNIFDKNKIKQIKFINNSKVHSGFLNDYNSIKNDLLLKIEKYNFYEMIACGHSLGGALAILFACEFKKSCVTFGSPRVGDKIFCNIFKKNVEHGIRIIIIEDPIPFVFNDKYKHSIKPFCITDDKNIYYCEKEKKSFFSCINEKAKYDIKKHCLSAYKSHFDFNKYLLTVCLNVS
jgi:hypothetical protein